MAAALTEAELALVISPGAKNPNDKRGQIRHCCVPKCKQDSRYDPSVIYHTFPADIQLRKKWIVAIRRDPGKEFKVCLHLLSSGWGGGGGTHDVICVEINDMKLYNSWMYQRHF